MDHPPLSLDQLSEVLSQAASHEALFEILCPYEDDANYLFTDTEITGDPQLLSAFYSIFLISHLLINEIHECRALIYRMPQTLVKGDPVLKTSISLLRAVWQNNHPEVYRILRQTSWPSPVDDAVDKFGRYFSEKSFQDVSRAYEAIRPKAVAEYLGLTEGLENENEPSPKLVDLLVAKGWSWDAETKLFHPKVPVKPVADTENLKSDGMSKVLELIGTYGD